MSVGVERLVPKTALCEVSLMLTISRQALAISVGGEATVAFQFVVKRFMDRNPCWFTQFGGRWRARCGSRFLRADVLPPSREPASHFQKSPTAILAGVRGNFTKKTFRRRSSPMRFRRSQKPASQPRAPPPPKLGKPARISLHESFYDELEGDRGFAPNTNR